MTCLVQNTSSSVGDSSSGSGWAPLYGGGTHLDQEAIQYIHKFYCKDCRMEAEKAKAEAAAAGGDSPQGGGDTSDSPEQPISPQAMLEEMSLQQSMDKNKESLKRKLMMRRSVTELVDQGIYPPLKTPPAFAEQRKHLERAKTGDLLRHKIIHRPDRQLLVQQHILEDTKIDPSLHERQRLLKRARLADDLNEKLLHRPGPLDLIRGNILKTEDDMLTDAIQDGVVQIQVPDGKDSKPVHFVFDDDSSEGVPSPSQGSESGLSEIGSPPVVPPAPDPPPVQLKSRPVQATITAPALTKVSPVPTQSITVVSTPISSFGGTLSSSTSTPKNGSSGNGISKITRQKKTKPKTNSKSKVIKFHEYKGPPSAAKSQQTSSSTTSTPPSSQNSSSSSGPSAQDTSYHVMLQQQQLFLQWQLEFQQKSLNVPVLLPTQKMESSPSGQTVPSVAGSVVMTSTVNTTPSVVTSTPTVVPAQAIVPAQVTTAVVAPSVLQGQTVTVPQTNTVIKQQVQPHTAQIQTVSQPQVQQVQQVQVQNNVQKPATQVRTAIQPVAHQTTQQSKSQSKSNHSVQKPFSNLEDMKVADLKAELKKRSLPVSGPKPQLIERLKPYVDVIIGTAQGSVNTSSSNEVMSLIKRPVQTIVSVKSVPLTALDDSMSMQSPPCSPKTEQGITTTPLSPEIMDIAPTALNAQSKSALSLSQSSIPMAVDSSRPPSVAPMDVTMEVDQPSDNTSFSPTNFSQAVTSPVSVATVTSPQPQQPPKQIQAVNNPPTAAPQISSEILLEQQRRIAQLQKELEESQMRLKLQQMQHHHLQQQQQQLRQMQNQTQTQTQLLQQPTSPPQIVQQPNSPTQQVIQQIIKQPTSPPQMTPPTQQPTPPPQIIHAMSSQPNSPAQLLQQPLSPPQILQQPISPPQIIQQPMSSQIMSQPLSSPQTLTTATTADGKISPIPHSVAGVTKFVQIPAQSLHSVIGNPPVLTTTQGIQLAQHGIPTVMVATSTASDNKKQGAKPNLTEFFKTHGLYQGVSIVKPATSSAAETFKQPTLFLTKTGAKAITLTAPVNGISTTRTTSLPSSPVEGKMSLNRTMSNPFFVPQKEPPKYDEAMRSKQLSQGPTVITTESSSGTVTNKIPVKSQAMDDVLEILIRTGELPPSAAQEPPPTPKTTSQTAAIPTNSAPVQVTTATTTTTSTVSSGVQIQGASPTYYTPAASDSPVADISSLLNSPPHMSFSVKQESLTPPPLTVPNVLSPEPSTHDLLDINDYMLNQDLNSMDWTSDQAFTLDLNDTTSMHMQTDQEMKCDGPNDFLNVPSLQSSSKGAPHGSEPDLTGLGLTDPDNCANVQMDVSDWLDVIMPSTGLTPLSANPPVSFPSDPILTPKTQQEVLELFNFDDTDFSTPTDLQSGINWEKLTETTGSS